MRSRAPSEASTHLSLEFSDSDIASISSQLNMAEIAIYAKPASPIPTAPTSPTTLPQVEDKPYAPLIPHEVVNSEPRAGSVAKSTKRKDALLYCEHVVFDVEDTLFCVPKEGLVKEGVYFNNLFNQVASSSALSPPQGSSDENPIVLDGVCKTHFRHLLGLIYPFFGVESPSTDEQWLGILHLATDWEVANIRDTAIKHLEHLFKSSSSGSAPTHDPIRALALCIQYGISQHLVHQFELIITSVSPLNHDAMIDVGLDSDVVRLIAEMRERWLCGKIWGMHRHPSLANHVLGLFPGRIPAKIIAQDLLRRSKLPELFSLPVTASDRDNKSVLEEEARLDAVVCRLRVKEVQIVNRLSREKEEAEERGKREAERRKIEAERRREKEEREREDMYQDAQRVVAEEEARRAAEEEERRTLEEQEKQIAEIENGERCYVIQTEGKIMEDEERSTWEAAADEEKTRHEMEEVDRAAREAEERCARERAERAERAERYANALNVIKSEQERRKREGQVIEKIAPTLSMMPVTVAAAPSEAAKKKKKKK